MTWAIAIGASALGALLGWMGYLVFDGRRDVKTLTGIVGVIAGTVVLGFFRSLAGSGPEATLPPQVWFYPVGLLVGFGLSAVHRAREKKLIEAKDLVVRIIKERLTKAGNHITMISFDELERIEPKLTRDLVRRVMSKYSQELCPRTLPPVSPGGPSRPGVGLVKP